MNRTNWRRHRMRRRAHPITFDETNSILSPNKQYRQEEEQMLMPHEFVLDAQMQLILKDLDNGANCNNSAGFA
ncbi:hypothetical protein HK100_000113, partial [Physocladia obscura]